MKRVILISLTILCVLMFTGCKNSNNKEKEPTIITDAMKFKEDYESLNGLENASGLEHRTVKIDENNPYIFSTSQEIIEKIENEETFFLYVGDKQCPWCRSVIEKSVEVAKANQVSKIYYLNIWDDDHNEILRDTYKLDDDNKPTLVKKGTDDYYKLLDYFKSVLDDYTLTTEKGKTVKVGEKRIYAPNYFFIEKGKVVKKIEGSSELQVNSRDELTDEILEDQAKIFDDFFILSARCGDNC